jgi:uncharacterized radical SAM superfamily Fe-S cluster-containing enzyme
LKLADKNFVIELEKHGVKRICLSFDGFSKKASQIFRNGDYIDIKLHGIENIKKYTNMKIWISAMLDGYYNIEEVGRLLDFAIKENQVIKGILFIAVKPINSNFLKYPTPIINLLDKLEQETDGLLSRKYFYEFYRLRCQLNELLSKIGVHFPIYRNNVYLMTKSKKIYPFISLDDLQIINNIY